MMIKTFSARENTFLFFIFIPNDTTRLPGTEGGFSET